MVGCSGIKLICGETEVISGGCCLVSKDCIQFIYIPDSCYNFVPFVIYMYLNIIYDEP